MNNYEIMMNGIVKIGEYAPEFEATTTMGNVKLSDYKGKWLVLFSHPRRFYPRISNFQTPESIEKTRFFNFRKLCFFKISKEVMWNVNLNDENKPNYYAIIPANIRYDNSLKAIEKLMYGEITALTNKEGYCFAKNGYFAELFEVANNTVSRWISNLEKKGYIKVDIIRDKRGQIIERRIFIVNTYLQNCRYPSLQNSIYPIYKIVEDNNINIRIDRLFNYIINNTGENLKDFPEKQLNEFKDLLNKLEFNYTKDQIKMITEENQMKLKHIIYCLKELFLSSRKALIHKLTREKLIYIYENCKDVQKKNLGLENEIKNFYEYFYISVIKELEKGI